MFTVYLDFLNEDIIQDKSNGVHGLFYVERCVFFWEVLNWFDSEAAAWVSGAAETVDYFG